MSLKDNINNIDKEGFFTRDSRLHVDAKHLAIVEDNADPRRIGRCRIRDPYIHSPDIDVEDLPWASPKLPLFFGKDAKGGSISIPKNGAIVQVEYANGIHTAPEYYILQELADDVKEELEKEYDGVHILGMDGDEDLKLYFTPEKGLNIYLKGSFINIGADRAITIEHNDTSSNIELRGGTITIASDSQINTTAGTRIKDTSNEVWVDGKTTKVGHQPQYAAVLGEPMFALLKGLASMIDAKLYPTPGVALQLVEQLKKTILSNTVKVSK